MTEQEQTDTTEPASESAGNTSTKEGRSAPGGSHGTSTAAWTGVGLAALGFSIMAAAVVLLELWIFILGVVVVILSGVAAKVLQMMGYGSPAHDEPPTSSYRGVR